MSKLIVDFADINPVQLPKRKSTFENEEEMGLLCPAEFFENVRRSWFEKVKEQGYVFYYPFLDDLKKKAREWGCSRWRKAVEQYLSLYMSLMGLRCDLLYIHCGGESVVIKFATVEEEYRFFYSCPEEKVLLYEKWLAGKCATVTVDEIAYKPREEDDNKW